MTELSFEGLGLLFTEHFKTVFFSRSEGSNGEGTLRIVLTPSWYFCQTISPISDIFNLEPEQMLQDVDKT